MDGFDVPIFGTDDDERMRRMFGAAPVSRPPTVPGGQGPMPPEPTTAAPVTDKLGAPPSTPVEKPMGLKPPYEPGSAADLRAQGEPRLGGWKKGLDIAGQILAPGIEAAIPGTPGNYRQRLGRAEGEETRQLGMRKAEADIAHTQAETAGLGQPKPKEEEWSVVPNVLGPNGEAVQQEKTSGEVRVVGTPGVSVKEPKTAPTHYESKPIADPTNPSQPKDALFDPIAGAFLDPITRQPIPGAKPYEKPDKPAEADKAINDYLAANNLPNTPANRNDARMKLAAGKTTATTAASEAAKATAKDTATSKSLETQYAEAQQFAANPSPTNDAGLLMAFIGVTKPESVGKIRFQMNELKYMEGTRSSLGDLDALGQRIASGQRLTPQQRSDMLATMKIIMDASKRSGGGGATGAPRSFKDWKASQQPTTP